MCRTPGIAGEVTALVLKPNDYRPTYPADVRVEQKCMTMIDRSSVYLAAARPLRLLPNFKGKVRALLAMYDLFGLSSRHVAIQASLARPVKCNYSLDLHSLHERMAFLMNEYESDTTQFLLRLHSGRGSFLDIGANIGLIAIPFAKERLMADGKGCIVYAVEALPSNISALKNNVSLNELGEHVRVVPFGVGEVEKRVEIQVENNVSDGQGTGTANILSADSDYDCERIPLSITTIDSLYAEGTIDDNVGVIKIDVDGYDLFAMQGASKFLVNARPLIFGEFMAHCMNWHGQTVSDVVAFMSSLDYSTYMRSFPGWNFVPVTDPSSYVQDLLIVPNERLGEVEWCVS